MRYRTSHRVVVCSAFCAHVRSRAMCAVHAQVYAKTHANCHPSEYGFLHNVSFLRRLYVWIAKNGAWIEYVLGSRQHHIRAIYSHCYMTMQRIQEKEEEKNTFTTMFSIAVLYLWICSPFFYSLQISTACLYHLNSFSFVCNILGWRGRWSTQGVFSISRVTLMQ